MEKEIITREEAIDIIIDELYECSTKDLLDILKEYFGIDDYEIKDNE